MARQRSNRRMSETERRRARQTRNKQKNKLVRILAGVGMGVLAVLIIAGLALPSFGGGGGTQQQSFLDRGGFFARPDPGPGAIVEDQGRLHFASLSDRADQGYYITYPPTSGTHSPSWDRCGIFLEPVPEEIQVHNLEHGFVIIQYNSDDSAFINELESVARDLPDWPLYYMFAPYPDMERPIALTAWNRLLFLDSVDEDAIREFADAYQARGPEVARGCDPSGLMEQGVPDPTAIPEGGATEPEPEATGEPSDDSGSDDSATEDAGDASDDATPEPEAASTSSGG